MQRHAFATWLLALTLPLSGGCGHDHAEAPVAQGTPAEHDHDHEHSHSAKNGGSLVVLAEEFANVEILVDAATGSVDLWSYDAHVENVERLAQTEIVMTVTLPGGEPFDVTLAAMASGLTGDTVGDSASFRGQHERLVGVTAFEGRLGPIVSRGTDFPSTAFSYTTPTGDHDHADHDHDHADHDHDHDHADHDHDHE